MVEVKLQERISKQGNKKYITYTVTIPKVLVEAIPSLKKKKKFNVILEKGRIILVPK